MIRFGKFYIHGSILQSLHKIFQINFELLFVFNSTIFNNEVNISLMKLPFSLFPQDILNLNELLF